MVVEWLAVYAPELNPVEAMWGHTKYGDPANFAPKNLGHLEGSVLDVLTAAHGERTLLAEFIRAAELESWNSESPFLRQKSIEGIQFWQMAQPIFPPTYPLPQ